MWFIIRWNVAGELQSPKNMTVGSYNPKGVENAAFHLCSGLICHLRFHPLYTSVVVLPFFLSALMSVFFNAHIVWPFVGRVEWVIPIKEVCIGSEYGESIR
jgi:hypothetical protein